MNERDSTIEALRRAADEVARELPAPRSRAAGVTRRTRWIAAAAAALVLLLLAPIVVQELSAPRDVEVEMMRVQGRDVPVRVIDDEEAGAILVRPTSNRQGAAMALAGELP